jgi:uncharacterized repeat protein (TIGR03803 family)
MRDEMKQTWLVTEASLSNWPTAKSPPPLARSFMKTHLKKPFPLPALIAALGLMLAGRVTAQTITTLHDFTTAPETAYQIFPNSDGANPVAPLILSGNTLYGTATYGGTNGTGTVFAVNTDGTGFTNLYTFSPATFGFDVSAINGDGADPQAGLILSGNTLYGTATYGGASGNGTVFSLSTNGTGFTVLHSFTPLISNGFNSSNSDGIFPQAGLVLSGSTLYGTAPGGGANGYGTVFCLSTNGTNFTVLHAFSAASGAPASNYDGAFPEAGLVLSGTTLYGTANQGGTNSDGTVFALGTNGAGFTVLHTFSAASGPSYPGTNSDGAYPQAGLFLSGNTLYGTAPYGGVYDGGAVFAVSTNGTNFTTLHSFTVISGPNNANNDGAYPLDSVLVSGNTVYGTAFYGGSNGIGSVFSVNTNGTGFTNLSSFDRLSDALTNSYGANPWAGVILSGNTLYGTTEMGGTNGAGTVYSLALGPVSPPPLTLTIVASGTNVILTWPTSATGYTLQSATNLVPPVAWATVTGQFAVTNPISGTRKFYRLSQ